MGSSRPRAGELHPARGDFPATSRDRTRRLALLVPLALVGLAGLAGLLLLGEDEDDAGAATGQVDRADADDDDLAATSVVRRPDDAPTGRDATAPTPARVLAGVVHQGATSAPTSAAASPSLVPHTAGLRLTLLEEWEGTREPVRDAEVTLHLVTAADSRFMRVTERGERRARTDAEGVLALDLPLGAHAFRVVHGERASSWETLYLRTRGLARDVLLEGGAQLRVRVVDPRGHPVPGAVVVPFPMDVAALSAPINDSLHGFHVPEADRSQWPSTGPDGAALVGPLTPARWVVVARDGLRAGRTVVTISSVDQRAEASIVLDEALSTGRLRLTLAFDHSPAAIDGYAVAACVGVEPHQDYGLHTLVYLRAVDEPIELRDLPPGPARLEVQVEGYAFGVLTADVVPGETVDVRVPLVRRHTALRGRVLLPDGSPARGGTITLHDAMLYSADLGADGTFALEETPEGPFSFYVEASGWPAQWVTDVKGDGPVLLQLDAAEATHLVRVRTSTGEPADGAHLWCEANDVQGVTDAAGLLRLGGAPGDRFELEVVRGDERARVSVIMGVAAATDVVLEPAPPTPETVAAPVDERGAWVSGQLTGTAPVSVLLELRRADASPSEVAVTTLSAYRGRPFHLGPVPPGAWVLRALSKTADGREELPPDEAQLLGEVSFTVDATPVELRLAVTAPR